MKNNGSKFTAKELRRVNLRWIWQSQIGWNYERMQGLGYLSTMLPVINRLYGDNPELKAKALHVHSQFFNTQPNMGDIIVGMNIAIEEQSANSAGLDVAASIKTALMGPFAGIGDTIFGMITGAVFGSIAATMALEGNAIGIAIWTLWQIACFFFRFKMFDLGYEQGIKLVTTLSGKMNALTEAAAVLGLTVVGCMIATMIKFNLASINVGLGIFEDGAELMKEFPLQTYADSIMPALFPAVLAALCYWLLGKKWMNSNKLIISVVIAAILLRFFGIVAA
ncbi:PTS system mannose/fructose/sorbose family transporter subunit IID [Anaerorhabdus furcosa]|uniref:PTS system, mannose-specific IID component n=1 Tax=Anaerorhabdus furcosa TaxID=118967 RepID=A0A1T4MWE6_9FIRM|nr:PTS system mannose/fructose/sorbose family transporter subunit IID [Anaerorhabdus furcosa]SJZ71241.1 PTS system, mannose-specific IID component [Anaerorhabdus furcosa]